MRFHLIDRIDALEPGKSLRAAKFLALGEEYLADHFPRFPVMPGVLMLQAVVEAAAWLWRATTDYQHPVIVLKTNLGDMTLRLDAEKAPRTVYNFMSYATSGHYDQTIFHQVDATYAILGGSYTTELVERPGVVDHPVDAALLRQ